MSLPFRQRPPLFESVIDFHYARLRKQCTDITGAERFIADHVADPVELLAKLMSSPDRVTEIMEQEIRKAAYWCAERTAEREDVTV